MALAQRTFADDSSQPSEKEQFDPSGGVFRLFLMLLVSRLPNYTCDMGLYNDRILPHLVNWAMRDRHFEPYRERVVSAAEGRVLEIGMGSGLNLTFYPYRVHEVLGLEPSERLLAMTRKAAGRSGLNVSLIEGSAEAIPLDRNSMDTVVMTWTLCTIPDASGALREMRRVLRTSGQLLFVEHGLAPETNIRKWQHRLTPFWKRIAGGCHLNRPIRELIENAGFEITEIDTRYMEGPKPMTFLYRGRARPK
jgi:ubiquinone/menaquinone biosynthesis C-methylase UbiE